MTTTTSTALATTRLDGLALYQDIWYNAKSRFWDPARAAALNAFEHCFDDRIYDIASAKRCAGSMLASLNDRYTKLLDTSDIEERAVVAQATEGSASSAIMPNNIGLLRIDSFSPENITEQVRKALVEIEHCDGFIIDLRDNLGGLVNQTVNCLELFVEEGMVVTLESQDSDGVTKTAIYFKPESFFKLVEQPDGKEDSGHYKRQKCMIKGKPVVVLVNKSTCSSAELFAAALLESGKNFSLRLSIGTPTSGKGIVQDTVPLKGCSLVVTSGRYLSPSDRWFGDNGQTIADGITPDIRVNDPNARTTLRKAHEVLCAHLGKEITPQPKAAVQPFPLLALMGWVAIGALATIGTMMLTPSRR